MEWSQEEIKFLEKNGYLLEEGDWDEFWLRTYGSLNSSSAKHLFLGVALVTGRKIKLEVYRKSNFILMTVAADTDEVKIFKSKCTDLSDISLMEAVEKGLTNIGASSNFIERVIGKMEVVRD
jgi:hypothetical protein